jgi:hypothetical protein
MTLQEFVDRARETGHIFAVEFVKRTDGAVREMLCRTGVTKGTHGGSMGYDPANHGLLSVYDMQRQGFRSIPVENVLHLSMNGQRYERRGDELVPVMPAGMMPQN